MIVAIDTQVLIWYVGSDPHDHRFANARRLVDDYIAAGHTIVVPAVVLGEFLHPLPSGDRQSVWKTVADRFNIASLDAQAAEIGAGLGPAALAMRSASNGSRQTMKADAMLVASARAYGATRLITNDTVCAQLAASVGMTTESVSSSQPISAYLPFPGA